MFRLLVSRRRLASFPAFGLALAAAAILLVSSFALAVVVWDDEDEEWVPGPVLAPCDPPPELLACTEPVPECADVSLECAAADPGCVQAVLPAAIAHPRSAFMPWIGGMVGSGLMFAPEGADVARHWLTVAHVVTIALDAAPIWYFGVTQYDVDGHPTTQADYLFEAAYRYPHEDPYAEDVGFFRIDCESETSDLPCPNRGPTGSPYDNQFAVLVDEALPVGTEFFFGGAGGGQGGACVEARFLRRGENRIGMYLDPWVGFDADIPPEECEPQRKLDRRVCDPFLDGGRLPNEGGGQSGDSGTGWLVVDEAENEVRVFSVWSGPRVAEYDAAWGPNLALPKYRDWLLRAIDLDNALHDLRAWSLALMGDGASDDGLLGYVEAGFTNVYAAAWAVAHRDLPLPPAPLTLDAKFVMEGAALANWAAAAELRPDIGRDLAEFALTMIAGHGLGEAWARVSESECTNGWFLDLAEEELYDAADHMAEAESLLRTCVGDAGLFAICHWPPGNPGSGQTITVDDDELQAHVNHGDYQCACGASASALDELSFAMEHMAEAPIVLQECEFLPFVEQWLVGGMYYNDGGAVPGDYAIRDDYLSDGVTTEGTILPVAGLELGLPTDEGWCPDPPLEAPTGCFAGPGEAPSVQLVDALDTTLDLNLYFANQCRLEQPDGTTVWVCAPQTEEDIYGGPPGNVMAYGFTYVTNVTNGNLDVVFALASDDSIQVLLRGLDSLAPCPNDFCEGGRNDGQACVTDSDCHAGKCEDDDPADGCEVGLVNLGRGSGLAGTIQNRFPATLAPGRNLITAKVFDGGGGWNTRLRLEEAGTGIPLISGEGQIEFSTSP